MSTAHKLFRYSMSGLAAATLASAGCSLAVPARRADAVTVEDILSRCAETHRTARTLSATGLVVDHRRRESRVDPVQWDYAAPNHSRLQLGMNVACVGPAFAWNYDAATDRFQKPLQASQTPIQSAAYVLTDQANFVPAGLVENGDALFCFRDERYEPWRLAGAAWLAGRPCYKLIRRGRGADSANRWTLWIDQDTHLLRSWAWHHDADAGAAETGARRGSEIEGGAGGDAINRGASQVVWQCTFSEIHRDLPVPDEKFLQARPAAIVPPALATMVSHRLQTCAVEWPALLARRGPVLLGSSNPCR